MVVEEGTGPKQLMTLNYLKHEKLGDSTNIPVINLKNLVSDKSSAIMKCDSVSLCFRSAAVWGHQSLHAQGTGWAGVETGWACHRFPEGRRWEGLLTCASFSFWFFTGDINQTAYTDKNVVSCFHVTLLAWCYGERMRDGERGWFPASCATEITNPTVMENNVQRMKRLRKETNV